MADSPVQETKKCYTCNDAERVSGSYCRGCLNEQHRYYYARNAGKIIARTTRWRLANRKKHNKMVAKSRAKTYPLRRQEAIEAYGGTCACVAGSGCGETNYKYLTFDHVNNDGAQHRKSMGGGAVTFVRWLKANNYPAIVQILCWNCNAAKQIHGGCDPHV